MARAEIGGGTKQAPASAGPVAGRGLGGSVVVNIGNGFADGALVQGLLLLDETGHERCVAEAHCGCG